MEIDYKGALKKLSLMGQEHLLKGWDDLSKPEKQSLLEQIRPIKRAIFLQQRSEIVNTPHEFDFSPLDHVSKQGDEEAALIGRDAISKGLVGALVMAGGQGTRLGFPHPKGCFPITKIKKKSCFQLVTEKCIACSSRAKKDLYLAFMTSKENSQETEGFFKDHKFFGAKEEQIGFFSQGNLPLLTCEGNLFLESKGKIAEGPDGNGSSIEAFVKSPLFSKWKKAGVRIIMFTLIDNPLADPFDEELVGRMMRNKRDVVIKATTRKSPDEPVGILVQKDKTVSVIEYTEFPESKKNLRKDDGTLLFDAANISLFCFDIEFFEGVARQNLPLHKALKKMTFQGSSSLIWKFERFIFDVLKVANNVETVIYPRNLCFSPLKNAEGEASPEQVQKDLIDSDRRVLKELFKQPIPAVIEEIAQKYYYPTEDLIKHTNIESVNNSYLE